jgi:hypothetical protein
VPGTIAEAARQRGAPSLRSASVATGYLACAVLSHVASGQPGGSEGDAPEIRDLGGAYAQLVSFAAEPEISASRFSIGEDTAGAIDQDMNVVKLPLYREFELEGRSARVYLQAAFSSLRLTEEGSVEFSVPTLPPVNLDAEWNAYTGALEAGLVMPLGGGFFLASGLGLGGSRLENETAITGGALGPAIEEFLADRYINWRSSAYLASADIGLLYRQQWGTLKVRGAGHIVYSYVDSFNESRGFPGFDAHNGSLSLKLDVAQPLSLEIGDEPLFLIGHVAATSFAGASRDELGFEHFYELGLALGYRQVALGVQAVLGPDVDGLSITFDYGF